MKRKHSTRPIIICAAILLFSCMTVHAQETGLLPEQFDGGFTQTKPAAFYNQGNLFELINGQAVFYLSYGFEQLEHTFYEKDGIEFTVDVYRLKNRLSAFGSYRQQKDEGADELDVGCEGYVIDYLSTFYKDRYYVEIIPSDPEHEDNITNLKQLAAQIASVIPGKTEIPPEIEMFPSTSIVPGSEMYTGENLLSYTFLGHGLTAEYTQSGDSNLRVFVSFAENNSRAREIMTEFWGKLENAGNVKLSDQVNGYKGELPYRGNSMVFSHGNYTFGCLGYTDENQALNIFKGLLENLN